MNWKLPPRKAAGFNFVVTPHKLIDTNTNTNLTNSGAPLPQQQINDASLNYLPYHENMCIDYRTSSSGTISSWNTLTTTDLNLPGVTPKPNLYAQTRGVYFKPGPVTTLPTGKYGPTGTFGNANYIPVFVYENENKFQLGGNQFQFRVYLKNKSEEILPSPDYFGTTDPSWNYLYLPDNSGSFFVFGSFGPATSPQEININGLQYNTLSISGFNNNPTLSNPVADASLNTPFPSLPLYNLHVNYGFDLSGSIDSSSKQVFIPPAPYQKFDISNTYITNNIEINNWSFTNITTDISLNVIDPNNSIIFPGYRYDVSGYYMKLNSDLSYNVYTDNYLPPTYPNITVSPPSRSQVTSVYTSMLGGTGQSTFFTNTDLSLNTGTAAIVEDAYPKGSNTLIQNIYFIDSTSDYSLINPTIDFKVINKRDTTENTSLGTDLCGNGLCRFILKCPSANVVQIYSEWRIGFVGGDTAWAAPTGSLFEMSVSASKDAAPFGNSVENYRKRGWYLGVDISNIRINDINLQEYSDISNNTPSYEPWNIQLEQDFSGNQVSQTVSYDLKLGKVPINPVSISGFATVQQTPTLTPDFFGISRPATSTVATWPVTALLSDLDPTWRPILSQWLMNGNLFYASSAVAASGNSMTNGNYGQVWLNTHPTSVNMTKNVNLLRSNLQNSSYYYSRARAFTPQFYITGTYTNNVTLLPSTTTVTSLNISFNSKQLWWDYTTLNPSLPFSYTLHSPGVGEYPVNYGSGGYIVAYNHANTIGDQQLMWCNTGGFTCGGYTTVATNNPYIDYTVYYGQTLDYSSKDAFGISKSLTYTASNDDYYEGGNKTITGTYKWILLSDTRVSPAPALPASSFGRLVVTGSGGSSSTLKLGDDYLLYIQEIDSYFNPVNNTVPSGYAAGRSGWKAVQGTWDQGATVNVNNANEAGAYRRNTNTGATAVHFIKFYSPNANTQIFYRIGLKNGDNRKISDVTITYGTT